MTSPYDRPSSAQTLGEGDGCLNATTISGVLSYNAVHIPLEITLTTRIFTQDNPSVHCTAIYGVLHIELN